MMQEFDPFKARRRDERPVREKTFTDPDYPGQGLTLRLRKLDMLDGYAAIDLANEYQQKWLGDEENGIEPEPFPAVGDSAVSLSRPLILSACNVYVAQPERKYDVQFFIAVAAASETLWKQITAFANEVNVGAKGTRSKNA